jgi:6-pyruvoyltetrahydropterin/6-carboxytetrahydropterin synthase
MIYVTRRECFNAAHKLWKPEWSDEKNVAVFGKCANKNWHGHNFELFVTIAGRPDPDTGFVFDLKLLSELLKSKIIDKLDHKNLNLDVDFMSGIMASTENLAIQIWRQIEVPLSEFGVKLHCVNLKETENNFVEYYGE